MFCTKIIILTLDFTICQFFHPKLVETTENVDSSHRKKTILNKIKICALFVTFTQHKKFEFYAKEAKEKYICMYFDGMKQRNKI
jgi:hypothetical protein